MWHAEIYQNKYIELNKGRIKKTKENNNNGEGKRNETNNERQNHQSRKGTDKWPDEMDILKSGVSQIKNYIKTVMDNKEWLKTEEGKTSQEENKEKKANKIENTKIK